MAEQPRYEPLEPSRLFADGQSARHLVPGVVPRGGFRDDPHFYLGVADGSVAPPDPAPSLDQAKRYAEDFPVPITSETMQRGRERYNIYCSPCHGVLGYGAGPVVEYGYPRAQSFHTERMREAPAGYIFDVITRGYRKMPPYARQVRPEDRWAIIAYLRALQLSQHAELAELPDELQERIGELD